MRVVAIIPRSSDHMPLPSGLRLGRYEIQFALGAGGMGEVSRARDTELHRDVAIKVLPEVFAADADRLARFKREAQVLASLNHPNIAAIYGIEEAAGVRALVLELVEGPTLADRIAEGAIPLDEAVPIARQIADALEAAHDQGVIHRDLKPANVKLRPDGAAKVLDFGLAKALEPVATTDNVSQSPTITSPAMTRLGMILGTATYMAPEQARGRAVDKRADIWAFGCVLFEMLTGRRAFDGDDVAETIGAVIHKDPDWNLLPATTPSYLRTMLRRCLQKDPRKRLPHIGIARIEIDDTALEPMREAPAVVTPVARHLWSSARLAWFVAAVVAVGTISFEVTRYLTREAVDTPETTRASILPPPQVAVASGGGPGWRFTLSPDGRSLAFLGRGADGRVQIWVRRIDAMTAQPLAGTDGVVAVAWSPDSRLLAFVAGGRLRKIDASGGPALTIADAASNTALAWNADDVILFSPDRGALFRVDAAGGTPSQVTTLDSAIGETGHWHPSFLPDNRHFLYSAIGSAAAPGEVRAVYIGSLDPTETPRILLQGGGSNPKYASGHVLFLRETTLMAQPLDIGRLELTGEAVPIAEQVVVGGATMSMGAFSVSQTGTLVYQAGPAADLGIRSQLVVYDRDGTQLDTVGEPADQMSIELSPDGTRVLASLLDARRLARDLWIYDIRRNVRSRFTFDAADEMNAAWSPDGNQVVFNSRRRNRFDLFQKAASGTGDEELVLADDQDKFPFDWSDSVIAYVNTAGTGGRTGSNIWTLPTTGDRKPAIFLGTEFEERAPRLSPNGRWLAYESTESGAPFGDVYVTSFPDRRGKWQVSNAGGRNPRWRADGKELFFLSRGMLTVVPVSDQGAAFQIEAARPLFQVQPRLTTSGGFAGYSYDVFPDGQRFLVNTLLQESEETSSEPIALLVNWPALLNR